MEYGVLEYWVLAGLVKYGVLEYWDQNGLVEYRFLEYSGREWLEISIFSSPAAGLQNDHTCTTTTSACTKGTIIARAYGRGAIIAGP